MPIRQTFVALAVTPVATIALGWLAAGGPSARNTGTEFGAPLPSGSAARLLAVERLAADRVHGPEDLAIEPSGDLLTGTADGRILRYRLADGRVEEVARTGGYPLGLTLDG